MKKKLLFLSTLGAAAGLVYALESNWRKQSARKESSNKNGEEAASNGHSAETSQVKTDSNGHAAQAGSMARIDNGKPAIAQAEAQPQIDDQGTDQAAASHILREIRDKAFEASDERLALALGRPTEEIEGWTSGGGLIDGDVLMKARALANQRGLEVE